MSAEAALAGRRAVGFEPRERHRTSRSGWFDVPEVVRRRAAASDGAGRGDELAQDGPCHRADEQDASGVEPVASFAEDLDA